MKYFALTLSLALFSSTLVSCNRVNPNIRTPGVVTFNSISAQSTSKAQAEKATNTGVNTARTPAQTNSTTGKSDVTVDTTADKDASFSNEDTTEDIVKNGRIELRTDSDWE